MSKLIDFNVRRFPASRLIGKQVSMTMNPVPDNAASALWQNMWKDGSMEFLKKLPCLSTEDPDTIGWMGDYNWKSNTFVYIAGVLVKEGAEVPEGFVYRDLPECDMGIAWIQGREENADLFSGAHDKFEQAMKANGYEYDYSAGAYEMEYYSFKRFGVPRFIGEKLLILDYYCPCKKIQKENNISVQQTAFNVADENKNGKSFDSLAKRVAYGYKSILPDFIPIEEVGVSEVSQRHMHGFLHDVISIIYENPAIINLPEVKDDFYENWELLNSKAELIGTMRKTETALLDFYAYLYKLGKCGEVRDNKLYVSKDKMKFVKKRLIQLQNFGLMNESDADVTVFYCSKYPELFPAWKLLCKAELVSVRHDIGKFIFCMYDISKYRAEQLFGNVTSSRAYIADLEGYFKDKGYSYSFDDYGIYWEKEYAEKKKGKADFFFDCKRRDQMTYAFHIPSFRQMLTYYNKMDSELKELTFSRAKKCDGCGYCTQTDKSGKRKPVAMTLEYNGQSSEKCPLWPNLTWKYIDEREVKIIKKLFEFYESISAEAN